MDSAMESNAGGALEVVKCAAGTLGIGVMIGRASKR